MFKNKYGELRSGWAIVMVVALVIIGQLVAGLFAPDDADMASAGLKIAVTLLYGCITIVGGLFLFKCLYGQSPQQLGLIFKKWVRGLLHGAAIGALSMGVIFGLLVLMGQVSVVNFNPSKLLSLAIVVELGSVSIFAFSEELLARGFMMTALKTTRNKWAIFIVPALLFSLIHFLNPGVTALSFINAFLAGLLFAYLFVKSGKVWLPAGFHIAWNFLQGDILGLNVSGGEAYAVTQISTTGTNPLLTGGEYGPEGSIVVTGILALCFLYSHFIVKPSSTPIWTVESDLPLKR